MSRFEHPPQKRTEALQPFSRDHHAGLVQAQRMIRAAESDPDSRLHALQSFVNAWAGEIDAHFADEERLLLDLMRPDDRRRMADEHARLRTVARQAREHRQTRADPGPDWARAAGEALRDHIRWEERELFPTIETDATDRQLQDLRRETDRIEAARDRDVCY